MASRIKSRAALEFGDFQTPPGLAAKVCAYLAQRWLEPSSILEPTCGEGAFLVAALERFTETKRVLGFEINPRYVALANSALMGRGLEKRAQVHQGDFFETNWPLLLATLPEPVLVVGNPPWVTNAELGAIGSSNLPEKSNFQEHTGLDAVTGKSNFDISEWMLIKLLESLNGRRATLAMLCKTGVARKVLLHAWKSGASLRECSIHPIDAARSFHAAVDACLLVCNLAPGCSSSDCAVHARLGDAMVEKVVGYHDGRLVADAEAYQRLGHLRGREAYRWRSGIKHDCGKVMELRAEAGRYRNGFGELVELERSCLYPMLKSSEIAGVGPKTPKRWMLVTQRRIGEETSRIEAEAPKTWAYLLSHSARLDDRASSIYRNRPRFSVFGVGEYSFAPWKVAISGLYKKLQFTAVGTFGEKPIVLDDTCYFLPCGQEEEAGFMASLLNSDLAREFLGSLVFWDAKRPITVDVLRQLDLRKLAKELGSESTLVRYREQSLKASRAEQLALFEREQQ